MMRWPGRRVWSTAGTTVAVAVIACGGEIANPAGGNGAGLRIVSGAPVSDTISSTVAQPLTVAVVDGTGRPAAGRFVLFEVLPAVPPTEVSASLAIMREGSPAPGIVILDTTDSRGHAAVRVQFGVIAGANAVRITVPELGYVDTARYTTLPGALHHVDVAPADTAAYVGKDYVLRAHGADRQGNMRVGDRITFSTETGSATVDATGAVVATAIGRASVVARAGGLSSTAYLSVVPQAVIAAQQHDPANGGPLGIFLMELDGSNRTLLAAPLDNAYVSGQGFGWSPDGRDLAIARGSSVNLVSPGSAERPLIETNGTLLLGARFSRDGQWIYYAHSRDGLSRVRGDGTALELIGNAAAQYGQYGQDYRPSPSADGQSIAYVSNRTPCGVTDCIRVLDIATGMGRSYGGRSYLVSGTNAAWSPTDDLIAYSGGGEVGVIRSDGTGKRVLATDINLVTWMDWSPDGKWLLVSPPMEPILFDVQTGTRLPIATLVNYGATAWRP
jgi:hypothetical protein